MPRQLLVYGHGDKSARGFPTPEALTEYLAGGIFRDEDGRYRYSQSKTADVILLARDGLAYGHVETDEAVPPTRADRKAYPPVKKVYLVRKSVLYSKPVRLALIGISRYQFGKHIDEDKFAEVLKMAGKTRAFARDRSSGL